MSNIFIILLGTKCIICPVIQTQCLLGFALEPVAVSKAHIAEECRFRHMVDYGFEIDFCLMVIVHLNVEFASKADGLFEQFVFLNALVNSL